MVDIRNSSVATVFSSIKSLKNDLNIQLQTNTNSQSRMSKIRFDAWCVFEVLHKEDQHFLIEEKEDEKEKCCLFDELVKPLNKRWLLTTR